MWAERPVGAGEWRALACAVRCCALTILALALTTAAADAVTISEFSPIVTETGGMARTQDGSVWVATATGITRMTSDGKVSASYATPTPSHLAVGPDGALWFSQPASTGIGVSLGRLGIDGAYDEHPIPSPSGAIAGITPGADGRLWYSESFGSFGLIGRMTVATGQVTEFTGSTAIPGALALGPDGNVWYTRGGGHVGRITPAGLVTEMPLAGAADRIAFAPGRPTGFYVASGTAGRITPAGSGPAATMAFTQGLAQDADNQDVAVGADGNGWFTETDDGHISRIKPGGQIDEFTTGIALRGRPHAIVAGPDKTLWFSDVYTQRIGRVVLDPPQALTGEAGGVTTVGVTLSAAVLPLGATTTAHFELGRTAAYGTTTALHDVGDGDASSLVSAPVTGLAPGTTYHYRIVASSSVGTSVGADRTFTTATPASPPSTDTTPYIPSRPDADGDGYPDSVDCRSLDPAIHPGAVEIPGNAIDEDCVGGAEPFVRFFPRTDVTFDNRGRRYSVFTRMVVSDVPAGASVRLACSGRGCGFSTWSSGPIKRTVKRLDLVAHLKRSRLRPHAVLELRLMRPGQIATVVRWTVGPPPRPVVTCLYPRKKKVEKCPR